MACGRSVCSMVGCHVCARYVCECVCEDCSCVCVCVIVSTLHACVCAVSVDVGVRLVCVGLCVRLSGQFMRVGV